MKIFLWLAVIYFVVAFIFVAFDIHFEDRNVLGVFIENMSDTSWQVIDKNEFDDVFAYTPLEWGDDGSILRNLSDFLNGLADFIISLMWIGAMTINYVVFAAKFLGSVFTS